MQQLADPRTLTPGAQIAARRRGYIHFGIYVAAGG